MVKAAWSAFGNGDIKAAFGHMADNVSWLIPGSIAGVSGVKRGKDEIVKFMASVGAVMPEGMHSEITRAYADGDTVILEVSSKAKVINGKTYENEYCFVFEIENGKIRRIREYTDTQKAKDILFS
jgi:ketosteroid isomerase-like protein